MEMLLEHDHLTMATAVVDYPDDDEDASFLCSGVVYLFHCSTLGLHPTACLRLLRSPMH